MILNSFSFQKFNVSPSWFFERKNVLPKAHLTVCIYLQIFCFNLFRLKNVTLNFVTYKLWNYKLCYCALAGVGDFQVWHGIPLSDLEPEPKTGVKAETLLRLRLWPKVSAPCGSDSTTLVKTYQKWSSFWH